MKIIVDENMPLTQKLFSAFGEVVPLAGRSMTADDLVDADILLVRSVTKVNAALLSKAEKLKFVGTATIGTDHVDQNELVSRQIPFCSAPGCNKISVGEYVISSLFVLAERYQFSLSGMSIGIIGAGNTGSAVAERASSLGMNVLLCDPIKAESDDPRTFVDYQAALKADIVSYHVPLTYTGNYPTFHLFNDSVINSIRDDQIFINACRGEVWDNQALYKRQISEKPLRLIMDVWEKEPDILQSLVPFTEIATPHIAGYSLDGKYRGTYMLYEQFCDIFNCEKIIPFSSLLPDANINQISVTGELDETLLKQMIHLVYDVRRDDARFRMNIHRDGAFDEMRKKYPERREWSSLSVTANSENQILNKLGFSIASK